MCRSYGLDLALALLLAIYLPVGILFLFSLYSVCTASLQDIQEVSIDNMYVEYSCKPGPMVGWLLDRRRVGKYQLHTPDSYYTQKWNVTDSPTRASTTVSVLAHKVLDDAMAASHTYDSRFACRKLSGVRCLPVCLA